jgi:diguanylate cyclase (GGDEF)-like protein
VLWVGTEAGLVRLDRRNGSQTVFRAGAGSLPSDDINVLYVDSARRLWVGTSDGLALWDPTAGLFHVYRNDPADPSSLPDNHIVSLHQDRTGLLWIGTKFGGLARWNPRTWSLGQHPGGAEESMPSRNVIAFTEDARGRLWVATFGGGLTIREPGATGKSSSLRQRPDALSDDRVMTLLTDREGMIWAGTMGGGLNRIDPRTLAVTAFRPDPRDPTSLPVPGVMSLLEDSAGRLWVGTYGGGLCGFNRTTGRCETYPSEPGNEATLASGRVTALAEDSSHRLWVGTDGGGLHVLDPGTHEVFRLRQDPRDPSTLSAATVYSIHVDARGTVWVGTRGGGLDRVIGSARTPGTIRFRNFTETQGLPNNTVYGIEADVAGRLWLSTNHGLARFDPASGLARAFHRSDGLQDEEFNFSAHYASRDGHLFFGGASGYNVFDPEHIAFDDTPPPVVLTSVSELDGLLPGALALARLHLHYRDVTTFEFAALDFTAPRANTFQFKLEGFDSQWIHAGTRRSVTYTNLPGGHYVLHARAANADGVWNETGAAIRLDVDPPPWATGWAYAAYALAGAMLVAGSWWAHRRSLQREARYSRRLEKEVRARTQELAARNTELESVNRRLEQASLTDPLTGLGNRRSLMREMPHLIAASQASMRAPSVAACRMTLMLVDLDRLKPINDQYGHEAGDQVLEQVATLLLRALRDTDRVVRWGGDEFVIVRTRSDLEDAAEVAEDLRRRIARTSFTISGSRSARTSCSIGFACYPFIAEAPSLSSWEEVLNMADVALYRAKARRNAWIGWRGRATAAEIPELAALLATDPVGLEAAGYIDVRVSPVPDNDTRTQRYAERS